MMNRDVVYGTRILVKKLKEKVNPLDPPKYNNKVEIIGLGVDLKTEHLKLGQKLLLMDGAGYDTEDETYITENQILKILGEA